MTKDLDVLILDVRSSYPPDGVVDGHKDMGLFGKFSLESIRCSCEPGEGDLRSEPLDRAIHSLSFDRGDVLVGHIRESSTMT